MEKRERLWVLLGLLVGFYGNWYFNLLAKFEELFSQDFVNQTFWIVSFLSLLFYCVEITHWKRTVFWGKIRLSFVLSLVHIFFTYYLYVIAGLSVFQLSGIILWAVISFYVAKMFYLD